MPVQPIYFFTVSNGFTKKQFCNYLFGHKFAAENKSLLITTIKELFYYFKMDSNKIIL